MLTARWRLAARQLDYRIVRSTAKFRNRIPVLAQTNTCIRPLHLTTRSRVQGFGSRVPKPSNYTYTSRPLFSNPNVQPLQSKFPKKTVLFLISIPLALYFFDFVEINVAPHWTERVQAAFTGNVLGQPLQFSPSKEHIDQLDVDSRDAEAHYRDPGFQKLLIEAFGAVIGGWTVGSRGVREDAEDLRFDAEQGGSSVRLWGGKGEEKGFWGKRGGEERRESGLPETHGCRARSNEPCEDYFAIGTSPGPGGKPWNFWGVYDGHAGEHTALWLQQTLIPAVSQSLASMPVFASPDSITRTVMHAFTRLDDGLMSRAKHAAQWYPPASGIAMASIAPALSGSCALLSMFDPETSKLRVACVGDSRAVLGRWDPLEEKYVCKPLSADQTGFNSSEVERITSEHPDEEGILDPKTGRLMGIAVTRAFGDHRWKWANDAITSVSQKFWGTAPRPQSKTPPYMTAEPVVTETDIVRHDPEAPMPGKSDFMIMASDGLWDNLSSDQAVDIVSRWLEARTRGEGSVRADPRAAPPPTYPLSNTPDPGVSTEKGYVTWETDSSHYAIEDENAAVCLVRNAFGGNRRNLFMGLVTVPPPWSRDAVDDTTVIVVFFDKDREVLDKEGNKVGGPVYGERKPVTYGRREEEREKRWWWPF